MYNTVTSYKAMTTYFKKNANKIRAQKQLYYLKKIRAKSVGDIDYCFKRLALAYRSQI